MFNSRICVFLIPVLLVACGSGSSDERAVSLDDVGSNNTTENTTTIATESTNENINASTNVDENITDTPPEIEQTSVTDENSQTQNETADINPLDDNEAVMQELPEGCIGDVDSSGAQYCFYPQDRLFIASVADGSTWWSFSLPGSNETNEIEAVVVVGNEVVLIADKSPIETADASEKYELSRFGLSGDFIKTLTVNLVPKGDINQCNDAWCPYYQNSNLSPYPNQQSETVIAQRSTTPSGESGLLVAWSRYQAKEFDATTNDVITVLEGSVISLLNLSSGQVVAEHLYPDELVETIEPQGNGNIAVTTDHGSSLLDENLMSTMQAITTGLNGNPITQWLHDWNAVVSANPLQQLADEVEYFAFTQLWGPESENSLALQGDIDANALFGGNAIAASDIAAAQASDEHSYKQGITQNQCSFGGTATITEQKLSQQSLGAGITVIRNQYYVFNQCAFSIDEQTLVDSGFDSLSPGAYLLNGTFLIHRADSTTRNGSNSTAEFEANTLALNYPVDVKIDINGRSEFNEKSDARNFTSSNSLNSDISLYSIYSSGTETRRVSNFVRYASLSTSTATTSWRAEIGGNIFDNDLGEQELSIQTLQPFSRDNNKALTNKPFDVFEGDITIQTDSGDLVRLQAISDQDSPFTREWLFIGVDFQGITSRKTIPLQSLYAPVSIED